MKWTGWSLACMALVALVGCGTTQQPVRGALSGAFEGAPSWVLKGCHSYYGARKAVCGVGSVTGTRNPNLARQGAIGRARQEIALSISARVKVLLDDYAKTVTGGSAFGTQADDDQLIEQAGTQFANMQLEATTVDEVELVGDTLWALVSVNPDQFEQALAGMRGLDPKIRAVVERDKAKLFERLDAIPETR